MKKLSTLVIFAIYALSFMGANADTQEQRKQHYNLNNGLALKGYDPVSYIDNNIAAKGSSKLAHTYQGITYRFKNSANLAKFKSNPNKYEPQYGGWCAFAFAVDAGKVSINPKRFKVIDGKLYLYYDTLHSKNTLKLWNAKDDIEQINKANKVWKKTLK